MTAKNPMLVVLVAAAAIGLAGCGSSSDSTKTAPTPATSSTSKDTASSTPSSTSTSSAPSTSAATSDTAAISIKDFAYQGPASVKPGAMVTVTNADSETHTLTSDESGEFDVNVTGGGGTATFPAPSKPGSYPYHCNFHGDMHGTLVVK